MALTEYVRIEDEAPNAVTAMVERFKDEITRLEKRLAQSTGELEEARAMLRSIRDVANMTPEGMATAGPCDVDLEPFYRRGGLGQKSQSARGY